LRENHTVLNFFTAPVNLEANADGTDSHVARREGA